MKWYHSPEAAGVDRRAIGAFLQALEEHDYRIHALLLARRDGMFYADAAAPYTLDTPHRLCSAAKSMLVLSMLAAMEEGRMHPGDPVLSFFPEAENADPRMARMTVEDLLTMRSGQEEDPFPALFADFDDDLIHRFLRTPMAEEPGRTFRYNNTIPHMIFAVTERAVGEKFEDYQNRRFCTPMDAPILAPTNPRGQYNPVVTSVSAMSFMKYALLFLREGDWFGQRLLQPESIRRACAFHTATGLEGNGAGYGWQIWRNAFGGCRMDGGWGQYALILPEEDAAAVILSDMTDSAYALEAFEQYLLPALGSHEPLSWKEGKPLPRIAAMAPAGTAEPAAFLREAVYRLPDGQRLQVTCQKDRTLVTVGEETVPVGLHGQWLSHPRHLWAEPAFSIDRSVWGVDAEPCLFSGGWETPDRLTFLGKSLGEMGEYRYSLTFRPDHVEIAYTPVMRHDVSTLREAATMRGELMP